MQPTYFNAPMHTIHDRNVYSQFLQNNTNSNYYREISIQPQVKPPNKVHVFRNVDEMNSFLNRTFFNCRKKLSMKAKIIIFKFAFQNIKDENDKNIFPPLTRNDKRHIRFLDKRLMEIGYYLAILFELKENVLKVIQMISPS